MTKNFTDIIAWQISHQFVIKVYKMTSTFPEIERFGLISQFQRAAVSITANIAEGYRKIGKADKLRFLNTSQGSLEECRNYIILSKDLEYINEEQYAELMSILEKASWYINAYAKGILNNNATASCKGNVR